MRPRATTQRKTQLRGDAIEPTDSRCEEARGVYGAMISPKPPLIARCVDAAGAIAPVQFARQQEFCVLIQCGGHSDGGLGGRDDVLVVDHPLIAAHVARAARPFQVGGGRTVGHAGHATQALQLAVPSGIVLTAGVCGLTLGAGIGRLARNTGLTIDNLPAAGGVLVNGSFVSQLGRRTR